MSLGKLGLARLGMAALSVAAVGGGMLSGIAPGTGATSLVSASLGPVAQRTGTQRTGTPLAARMAGELPKGTITTAVGGLGGGSATHIGQAPYYIAVSGSTLYLSDFANNVVRAVDLQTGAERVVAGNGIEGFSGDGGPATSAELDTIAGIAVDAQGDLFISDQVHDVVREVAATTHTQFGINMVAGDIYTIAGIPYENGAYQGNVCGKLPPHDGVGDGCPATQATLLGPVGLAFDSNGDLLIADQTNGLVRIVASGGSNPPSWAPPGMQAGYIYSVAGMVGKEGTSPPPDGTGALQAELDYPQGVYVDPEGNLFIGEDLNSQAPVLEVPATDQSRYGISMTAGDIYTVAGGASANCSGAIDSAGDGCPATQVDLTDPAGQVVNAQGDLLTVNYYDNVVQEVSASTGTVSLVAGIPPGQPQQGCALAGDSLGDGCPATQATLDYPTALAFDAAGNLLIADAGNVRMVAPGGTITNVAGDGFSGLFGVSSQTNAIPFRVGAAGASGDCPIVSAGPCGAPSQVELNHPSGISFDAHGNLFISDTDSQRIREVAGQSSMQEGVNMVAGQTYLAVGGGVRGYTGNGGPAFLAGLSQPQDVVVDSEGDIFIADTGDNTIREVPAPRGNQDVVTQFGQTMMANQIYTIAGGGNGTCTGAVDPLGDGCAGTSAVLNGPTSLALDSQGNLFIADAGDNRVRFLSQATGDIYTYAGTGTTQPSPANGTPAVETPLADPSGLAVDGAGDLFVTCSGSNSVVEVASHDATMFTFHMFTGDAYTVAGTGTAGFSGDGGPATSAELDGPTGIAVDGLGNVFIADTMNNRVREVYAGNDVITTVAGNGRQGFSGDGGPATSASLWEPRGIAIDALGNLFISDTGDEPVTTEAQAATGDNRIREVTGVTLPEAPTGVAARPWVQGAVVTWTPDTGFAGAAPFSYTVTAEPGGATVTVPGTQSSATVSGLQPGGSYSFQVVADGPAGSSPPSFYSAPVTVSTCTGPTDGNGYWEAASDGGVFSFDAPFCGSTGNLVLNKPVVGMAPTPDGLGYWLVASDGGIFAFGDAGFYGSTGAMTLSSPIVGMAPTPDGKGYWLVAADGGIFSFGDAQYWGSCPQYGICRGAPIVGMAPTPDGKGYWLVDSAGNVYPFGDAYYHDFGGVGNLRLAAPVVSIAPTPGGFGYWLVAADGGIFSFGDARFYGSCPQIPGGCPGTVVGVAPTRDGGGYWLMTSYGDVYSFGDAQFHGSMGDVVLNRPVIAANSQ